MTYGEYWLLETACTYGVPVAYVWGTPNGLKEYWNKPFHAMSLEETADSLMRLFHEGDIEARDSFKLKSNRFNEKPPERSELPDRDEILDVLANRPRADSDLELCYWLTAKGGDRWAAQARADWTRFFDNDFEPDDYDDDSPVISGARIGTMSLRTASRARLDFLVDTVWRWWQQSHDRYGGEVVISEVVPWQATYWKRLPHAYQAVFPVRYYDRNIEDLPQRVLDHIRGMSEEQIAAWSTLEDREVRHWHEGFRGA